MENKDVTDSSYKCALARGDLASNFDALVIDSGAVGLTAATLMALDGEEVLVLECHADTGGRPQVFRCPGFYAGCWLSLRRRSPSSCTLLSLFNKITCGGLTWQNVPTAYNRITVGNNIFERPAGSLVFKQRMKEFLPEEADAIDRYIELVNEASRPAGEFLATRSMQGTLFDRAFDHGSPRFIKPEDRYAQA